MANDNIGVMDTISIKLSGPQEPQPEEREGISNGK